MEHRYNVKGKITESILKLLNIKYTIIRLFFMCMIKIQI